MIPFRSRATRKGQQERLEPIREWVNPDGKEMISLHPLYFVFSEQLGAADKRGSELMRAVGRLMQETFSGERRFTDAMAERMLEIDAEQRAHGAPDDRLDNLAALLQGRPQDDG